MKKGNNTEYDVQQIFVDRLKYLMCGKSLNLKSFSEGIGIPDSTISDWLLKKTSPNMFYIVKVALFFKVSTDYLLGLVEFEN